MKQDSIAVAVLLSISVLVACSKESAPSTPSVKAIDLQQEWFPFAGFAGEVSGSKRFAAEEGIKLNVLPGSEQVDPIKLVLAGTSSFGVVGGDLLVSAVEKGAPLVAIGVVNCRSPTVFLVPSSSGINGPKEFVGRKVGILTGTNTERIYQLMMKRAGIDRGRVSEIQIPFDLQTFILGQYDVRPAFAYDEPVSLDLQKVGYGIIKPEDFDVAFTGTVYFTSRKMLETNRETVVAVLKTLVKGWRFALANPEAAMADLREAFPSLDQARERKALEMGKPYFSGASGQPLTCAKATWASMIAGLIEINALSSKDPTVTVDQVWNPEPLREAYQRLEAQPTP